MADQNKSSITGANIYKDNKGRTIFYDRYAKKAYMIPKQDENTYYYWSLRAALCLTAALLLYLATSMWWLSIAAGAVLYLVSTVLFYRIFVNSLPPAKGFHIDHEVTGLRKIYNNLSFRRSIIGVPLFIAMFVMLYTTMNTEGFDSSLSVQYWSLMIVCAVMTVLFAVCAFLKYKEEKRK